MVYAALAMLQRDHQGLVAGEPLDEEIVIGSQKRVVRVQT